MDDEYDKGVELVEALAKIGTGWKYKLGDRVTKIKGSSWTGKVVGFYSTSLTPEGYAIESENEPGSVQVYPVSALSLYDPLQSVYEASNELH